MYEYAIQVPDLSQKPLFGKDCVLMRRNLGNVAWEGVAYNLDRELAELIARLLNEETNRQLDEDAEIKQKAYPYYES